MQLILVILFAVLWITFSSLNSSGAEVTSDIEVKAQQDESTEPSKQKVPLKSSVNARLSSDRGGFKKRGSNIKFGGQSRSESESTSTEMSGSGESSKGSDKISRDSVRGAWDHLLGKKGEDVIKLIKESELLNPFIFLF
jgi:hypothetical protein